MTIDLGCPGGHIPVETLEDVNRLINETNDMHDAYLLSADYRAYVRANNHTVVASTEGESLVLRYQVTSLPDLPVVELTFLNVAEWKVPSSELFSVSVSFDTPFVTFFDGNTPENATFRVKARKMYWRIVDRPNLQRGGTKDAVWYVIPRLWLPLEGYAPIIEELAATVPNAKIYHTDSPKPLPCGDAAFTTDHIHSFRSEEATYTEDGKAFCWYELSDSEALKEAVSMLDDGKIIAIFDDTGIVFTVEMIEWGHFNMVICSPRGRLPIDGFCGGRYYVEPYSGGGMEELS
jgi:hypothetical protein